MVSKNFTKLAFRKFRLLKKQNFEIQKNEKIRNFLNKIQNPRIFNFRNCKIMKTKRKIRIPEF